MIRDWVSGGQGFTVSLRRYRAGWTRAMPTWGRLIPSRGPEMMAMNHTFIFCPCCRTVSADHISHGPATHAKNLDGGVALPDCESETRSLLQQQNTGWVEVADAPLFLPEGPVACTNSSDDNGCIYCELNRRAFRCRCARSAIRAGKHPRTHLDFSHGSRRGPHSHTPPQAPRAAAEARCSLADTACAHTSAPIRFARPRARPLP